jgi:hypothetical protein
MKFEAAVAGDEKQKNENPPKVNLRNKTLEEKKKQ